MKKDKILKYIIIAQVSIFLLLMLAVFLYTKARVPDEIWFMGVIKSNRPHGLKEYLFIQNFLGYGSIYWTFIAIFRSIFILRLFAWFSAAVVPLAIIYIQKKILNASLECVILSLFLYFSIPCVYFTGKIIGPELYSNALGVVGCTVILYSLFIKNHKQKLNIFLFGAGSFLIGISSGIKLYNSAFGVFILSIIFFSGIENKIPAKKIVKKEFDLFLYSIIGFFASNLIIFRSFKTFINNLIQFSSPFSLYNIKEVLFRNSIAWDLVNTSGLNCFIIPFYILILLYIMSFVLNKKRTITLASLVSTVFLILLCTRDIFIGWYLMPITFFTPLIISLKTPPLQKNKKQNYFLIIILLLNLIIMLPWIYFQFWTKIETIKNMYRKKTFEKITTQYNDIYKDYNPVYVLDLGLKKLPYSLFQPSKENHYEKSIIYFSEHSKKHKAYLDIINEAMDNKSKFKFVKQVDDVTIILYNPDFK